MMFGSKKSAQEKAMEKERKKYGTRKYGQTVDVYKRQRIRREAGRSGISRADIM